MKGFYTGVRMECEEPGSSKQSWLATWPRDLIESRANKIARLDFLSCSAPASMMLQLLSMLGMYATSGEIGRASCRERVFNWV